MRAHESVIDPLKETTQPGNQAPLIAEDTKTFLEQGTGELLSGGGWRRAMETDRQVRERA